MQEHYRIEISRDGEGWMGYCPDLPGVMACSALLDECLRLVSYSLSPNTATMPYSGQNLWAAS